MAAAGPTIEHQYFYEDQVYRVNRKGHVEFGMVLENSELASSDENSDTDDGGLQRHPLIKKGHIRVAWHPSGVEEVIPERKVHLADRSLMPGDVVRRMIKGKDTQRGYCRDIRVTAAVQIVGTKNVFSNVKSDDLVSIEEFLPDTASCLDSWVGAIKEVHSRLHLSFTDGSKCIINDIEACGLQGFEKRSWDSEFPSLTVDFYPGQVLCGPLSCLEQAEWVNCTKELNQERTKSFPKRVRVTVDEIKTHSVDLHWQCRAYSKDGVCDREQPKFLVQGEDLKRLRPLNIFEPCTLQVGDRRYYTIKTEDAIMSKEQWRRAQRDRIRPTINTGSRYKPVSRGSRITSSNFLRSTAEKEIVNNNPAAANNLTNQQLNLQQRDLSPRSSPTINENQNHLIPPPPQIPPISNTQMIDQNTDDEYTTDDTASASDTYSNSSSGSQGKKKRGPALMTRVLKKKKLRRAKKRNTNTSFLPGTRVVVETLSTSSIADVVWQDGSVELGIPSTQLYPIHHLDDQEFFPGDFVIENKEDSSMRVYGVVQSVDHAGRTAKVLWFRTYTSLETPRPSKLEENEVSVYDLKDHPDFQYRPGTVVIRVANFEGEDVNCTAGQVLDNYPEGKVRVWWVDGHISMSWPQDLYKVGEYDSDEGEFWDGVSSSASWETESENCFIADEEIGDNEADASTTVLTFRCNDEHEGLIKPKLAANIEKARIAMSRLEEIFTQDPALQTNTIMRQMLDVYKDCRYLDRLMGTSFFHETHFQGLIERVRERGRPNLAQRVADQVSRLFQHSREDSPAIADPSLETNFSENSENKPNGNVDSGKSTESNKNSGENCKGDGELSGLQENLAQLEQRVLAAVVSTTSSQSSTKKPKPSISSTSQSSNKDNNVGINTSSNSLNSHNMVCVRLCSLIKAQLVEAHAEVTRRFGGGAHHMKLSDAVKSPTNLDDKLNKSSESLQMDISETNISNGKENVLKTNLEDNLEDVKVNIEEVTLNDEHLNLHSEANEGFSIIDTAPNSHKFKLTMFQPTDPQSFFRTVRNELKLLKTSLPPGIWVKGFEDRMDLYSVMIRGPARTPYEDGLFIFDVQLSGEYPRAPPLYHYISYCSDRLNPNLYEDGKVCVSLLGTWSGKGTEVWTTKSNLLQVIVSIQGLILVSEPYFNEAGYEKQKGSQQGNENSRMYNEMAVLKLVQALTKLILNPPSVFKDEIFTHFRLNASKMLKRLDTWLEISEKYNQAHPVTPTSPTNTLYELQNQAIENGVPFPEFPLIPASKGFCLTLRKAQATFRQTLISLGLLKPEMDLNSSKKPNEPIPFENEKIKTNSTSTHIISTPAQTTINSSRIESPLVIAEIPTGSKTVTDIS